MTHHAASGTAFKPAALVIALLFWHQHSLADEKFGVCDREIGKVNAGIQADFQQWIDSVKDMPPEVRDAYIKIFTYNRDQGLLQSEKGKQQCYAEFRPIQEIVDGVVRVYTLGLSDALPKRMTNIDVSEIMAGKPLGGPNAAVPKFRDQIFKSLGVDPKNPGTLGNIIKDPWNCITFRKKC